MNVIRTEVEEHCPTCDRIGLLVELTRMPGAGAEMLITCKHCGAQLLEDFTENQARLSEQWARPPSRH